MANDVSLEFVQDRFQEDFDSGVNTAPLDLIRQHAEDVASISYVESSRYFKYTFAFPEGCKFSFKVLKKNTWFGRLLRRFGL